MRIIGCLGCGTPIGHKTFISEKLKIEGPSVAICHSCGCCMGFEDGNPRPLTDAEMEFLKPIIEVINEQLRNE